jgi:hypothetical protein
MTNRWLSTRLVWLFTFLGNHPSHCCFGDLVIYNHRAADNVACAQEVEVFVDLSELNGLDDVTDLAPLG